MVAANSQPLVSSVPLRSAAYLLGEVTNMFQPTKLGTFQVNIPNPLLGNEARAGFAAFTVDGVSVTCGTISSNINNFVGFFENMYFDEWDPGSITGTDTMADNFRVSVCQQGTIFVYNSTAVSTARTFPIYVITSVTPGTTPAEILVGSIVQAGSLPAGTTGFDISSVASIVSAQAVVGAGILINVIKA